MGGDEGEGGPKGCLSCPPPPAPSPQRGRECLLYNYGPISNLMVYGNSIEVAWEENGVNHGFLDWGCGIFKTAGLRSKLLQIQNSKNLQEHTLSCNEGLRLKRTRKQDQFNLIFSFLFVRSWGQVLFFRSVHDQANKMDILEVRMIAYNTRPQINDRVVCYSFWFSPPFS